MAMNQNSNPEKKETLAEEVIRCVGDACKGMAYDMKKWNELPADTTSERVGIVFTRGGRLPWLVLAFSVCFFVFFAVTRALPTSSAGKSPRFPPMAGGCAPFIGY